MNMRMTINRKLLGGFSAIILLLLCIGWFSYIKIDKVDTSYTDLLRLKVREVLTAYELVDALQKEQVGLRGYALLNDPIQWANFEAAHKSYLAIHEDLLANTEIKKSSKLYKLIETLNTNEHNYHTLGKKIYAAKQAGDTELVHKLISIDCPALIKKSQAAANDVQVYVKVYLQKNNQTVTASANADKNIILIVSVITALIGIAISLLIGRFISRPVTTITSAAQKIADGDLTGQPILVKNNDELGQLAKSFNQMATNLRNVIVDVGSNARQVAASSEELTASANQSSQATAQVANSIQTVANGSEIQVRSVEHGLVTVNEMSASFIQIASNTENVSDKAQEASNRAEEGNVAVQTVIQQMGSINNTVNNLAAIIGSLGEQSKQVHQIVDVIREISAQTNLLSLNAAIEAARAGEHGRGFDVVAKEVQKLAGQSANSAKEIAGLISNIQQGMFNAVNSMQSVTAEVQAGITFVENAGDSFIHIRHAVTDVTDRAQQVSAAVQQIAGAVNEMTSAMKSIMDVTQDSAASTEEVSAATEQQLASSEEIVTASTKLSRMAEDLQNSIERFKISL